MTDLWREFYARHIKMHYLTRGCATQALPIPLSMPYNVKTETMGKMYQKLMYLIFNL